jgi:hypothetical protein
MVDGHVVKYLREKIDIRKIMLFMLVSIYGFISFLFIDKITLYLTNLGLVLKNGIVIFPFVITILLFLIPILLSYIGKKNFATMIYLSGFISFLIFLLFGSSDILRWDLYLLSIGCLFTAGVSPVLFFNQVPSFKKSIERVITSSIIVSILILGFSLFYVSSITSDVTNLGQYLNVTNMGRVLWLSFVISLFSFLGIILIHEGILYFLDKKRIVIDGITQYVSMQEVQRIMQESLNESISETPSENIPKKFTEGLNPLIPTSHAQISRCGVCFGKIKPGSSTIICPECKKIFHESCANRIKKCPHCNADLEVS